MKFFKDKLQSSIISSGQKFKFQIMKTSDGYYEQYKNFDKNIWHGICKRVYETRVCKLPKKQINSDLTTMIEENLPSQNNNENIRFLKDLKENLGWEEKNSYEVSAAVDKYTSSKLIDLNHLIRDYDDYKAEYLKQLNKVLRKKISELKTAIISDSELSTK